MSFMDFFKGFSFEKLTENIVKFFEADQDTSHDVNPILSDHSALNDIPVSEDLMGHLLKGDVPLKTPANDDSPFFTEDEFDAQVDLGGLIGGDDHDFDINYDLIDETTHIDHLAQGIPGEDFEIHLHVAAEDVLDMGNHIVIAEGDVAQLSFQDEGWNLLDESDPLPDGSDVTPGFDTYIHDTGAILQIDQNIDITPPEM